MCASSGAQAKITGLESELESARKSLSEARRELAESRRDAKVRRASRWIYDAVVLLPMRRTKLRFAVPCYIYAVFTGWFHFLEQTIVLLYGAW